MYIYIYILKFHLTEYLAGIYIYKTCDTSVENTRLSPADLYGRLRILNSRFFILKIIIKVDDKYYSYS